MSVNALSLAQVQKLVMDEQDIYVLHSFKHKVVFYSIDSVIDRFKDKWNWREMKLNGKDFIRLGCGAMTYIEWHRPNLKLLEGKVQ